MIDFNVQYCIYVNAIGKRKYSTDFEIGTGQHLISIDAWSPHLSPPRHGNPTFTRDSEIHESVQVLYFSNVFYIVDR